MCEYKISVQVPQATPTQVWDFMADFSNMRLLNPLLVSWRIIGESNDFRKQVQPVGMSAGREYDRLGLWLIGNMASRYVGRSGIRPVWIMADESYGWSGLCLLLLLQICTRLVHL